MALRGLALAAPLILAACMDPVATTGPGPGAGTAPRVAAFNEALVTISDGICMQNFWRQMAGIEAREAQVANMRRALNTYIKEDQICLNGDARFSPGTAALTVALGDGAEAARVAALLPNLIANGLPIETRNETVRFFELIIFSADRRGSAKTNRAVEIMRGAKAAGQDPLTADTNFGPGGMLHHAAAFDKSAQVMAYLIASGGDVNRVQTTPTSGRDVFSHGTPLFMAAEAGNTATAKMLVAAGATNAPQYYGQTVNGGQRINALNRTPEQLARSKGHKETADAISGGQVALGGAPQTASAGGTAARAPAAGCSDRFFEAETAKIRARADRIRASGGIRAGARASEQLATEGLALYRAGQSRCRRDFSSAIRQLETMQRVARQQLGAL